MALPQVSFHTGLADPVRFACRILRKAWRQRARVLVTAPPDTAATLDAALWTSMPGDFLPHLRLPAAAALLARTPIWIAATALPVELRLQAPRIRLNLGAEGWDEAGTVDRVIELVGDGAEAVRAGRARWRRYEQDWGVKPEHLPVAG